MEREQEIRSRIGGMVKKLGRWLLVLLWMGLIFYLSAQPDLPHYPEGVVDLVIKKVGHMAQYGILAALAWWAWPRGAKAGLEHVFLCAFVLSGFYAISDEVHQSLVPGRNGRLLDVGFDLLGAALALLLISHLASRREPQ